MLKDARVMMFPGPLYGDHCDDYVRISLLQPVARIQEAAARMAPIVAAMRADKKT
jgi:aspartate/methionine/tyrosine aminotransferase